MEAGVWQVEGLTVGGLAQKVGAPEHQVRKAINRGLGHRNFASFINRARIDAAIKRLDGPEASEETILEIAFDVGFSSLGPFNRAFRETTGKSPKDFRKQALAQMAAA
jgi:AraC-like DNA-binding protein